MTNFERQKKKAKKFSNEGFGKDIEYNEDTLSNFLSNLMLTNEVCQNLEKGTRGQQINNNWREARSCLITASVMGEVVKRIST